MVKKILVSQPKPSSDKSPYYDIANDFGVDLVFRPFIKVEGLSSKEFRQQKISLLNYTAVVFTSRHAIDNYFKLAKEMRLEIPEDMKYFCVTETISLYIQKYVQYRKRKVFYGSTGKIADLVPTMVKHKTEKYLIPMSDVHDNSEEESAAFDYDMAVFFSPSGITAFKKNFGDKYNDIAVATFGPATAKAAHEAGLKVAIEAPTKEFPSMTGALRHYLLEQEG